MTGGSVGRRYARAIIAIAKERDELDRVGGDLSALAAAIESSAELRDLLQNPVFAKSQRKSVIEGLIAKLALSPTTMTVARLLVDRDRIDTLPSIVRAYVALADEHAGRVRAAVSGPAALSDADRATLTRAIAEATRREVILDSAIDESLIGGLVTRVGSVLYDGSVRTHLASLRERLLSVG